MVFGIEEHQQKKKTNCPGVLKSLIHAIGFDTSTFLPILIKQRNNVLTPKSTSI